MKERKKDRKTEKNRGGDEQKDQEYEGKVKRMEVGKR
jgi:hypothetical protein